MENTRSDLVAIKLQAVDLVEVAAMNPTPRERLLMPSRLRYVRAGALVLAGSLSLTLLVGCGEEKQSVLLPSESSPVATTEDALPTLKTSATPGASQGDEAVAAYMRYIEATRHVLDVPKKDRRKLGELVATGEALDTFVDTANEWEAEGKKKEDYSPETGEQHNPQLVQIKGSTALVSDCLYFLSDLATKGETSLPEVVDKQGFEADLIKTSDGKWIIKNIMLGAKSCGE